MAVLKDSSADIIRKKYVRDDEEDEIYLSEYGKKQKVMRSKINEKLKEMSEVEDAKNKAILSRIEEKSKFNILKIGTPKK